MSTQSPASSTPVSPSVRVLPADERARALAVRDLTDPAAGPHAMQLVVDAACAALGVPVVVDRGARVVSVADNYDRLGYPQDGAARDARYTRYASATTVLRTQTSAIVPGAIDRLAAARVGSGPMTRSWNRPRTTVPPAVAGACETAPSVDVVLACPGVVYRRDVIDRLHVGEPHQLDLWRLRVGGPPLRVDDLDAMIAAVVAATLPGRAWRTTPAVHPYTTQGRQIDVDVDGAWIEIGECGLAARGVIAALDADGRLATGLAMGLGLDRLLMIRKGVDDIRLLRSTDPRVARQMLDLDPYRPVSRMPPIRRDLSIAVDEATTPEELGDRVRAALGDDAASLEEVAVVAEAAYASLPPSAHARMGMKPAQKNVLLRVVVRDLERTLSAEEGNALRDRIYAALHEGDAHEWAAGERR